MSLSVVAAGAPELETDAQYVERVRDDMDRYYERRYPNAQVREELTQEEVAPAPSQPAPAAEQPLHVTFNKAQAAEPPTPSRADQIKKDMEGWRARHLGKDLGREI